MKKLIFCFLFIAAISPAFAQSVKFGIDGGLNESIFTPQNLPNNHNSRIAGFHAGVFSDIDFGTLTLQPGLQYTTKGQNNEVTTGDELGNSFYSNGRVKYNYLELPVNLLYNIPVGAGKFFVGGGPYLAYGLSANFKGVTTVTENSTTTNDESSAPLTFGSAQGDIKRFDYGLGALGGFALKNGVQVSIGYEFGLANLTNESNNNYKNSVLTFSLGYSFL